MAALRKKERIAILGAGPSALVSAMRLTETKALRDKYDITIYQQGWRVGGKCATGRDLDKHMRLYEHGIHGFLGCYFNALTVMQDAFKELGRKKNHPLPSFEKAFYGMSGVIRYEMVDGEIKKWPIQVPTNDDHREALSLAEVKRLARMDTYSLNMIKLGLGFILQAYVKTYRNPITQKFIAENFGPPPSDGKHPMKTDPANGAFDLRLEDGKEEINAVLARALGEILPLYGPLSKARTVNPAKLEDCMKAAAKEFNALSALFANIVKAKGGASEAERDRIRRAGLALNFVAAILTGVVKDDLLYEPFSTIDDQEHWKWLKKHGASAETINSPLTSSTPNITYQYPMGDSIRLPTMAAGAYLHWTMMTFTYMGEFIQLFEAGSGETLIAPIYEVLVKRGVKFAFFHTVTDIRCDKKAKSITEFDVDVQATVKKGALKYDPYVDVKGLDCWPDRPLYDQLKEGEALKASGADLESFWCDWAPVEKKTLKCGEDFDQVLIGISVGGVKHLTKSLKKSARWKAMLDNAVTVSTQAMQIWLNKTPWDLGWNGYSNTYDDYLLSANFMTQPNGQGDFTKYIAYEDWPEEHEPKSLLLLCGTIPFYHEIDGTEGADFPRRITEQVKHQSIQFLQSNGGSMLPGATVAKQKGYGDPFSFDFDLLHPLDPKDRKQGAERFDDQYWRVNVNPSDNYVSTPPKSTKHRLYANDTGFKNLSIAGDWTSNGLNVGSMEGSVRSGLLAAEAILGIPHSKTGVIGFDPTIARGK